MMYCRIQKNRLYASGLTKTDFMLIKFWCFGSISSMRRDIALKDQNFINIKSFLVVSPQKHVHRDDPAPSPMQDLVNNLRSR